jgi:hypothetical protein
MRKRNLEGGYMMMYLEVKSPEIFRHVVDEIGDTMGKYLVAIMLLHCVVHAVPVCIKFAL